MGIWVKVVRVPSLLCRALALQVKEGAVVAVVTFS